MFRLLFVMITTVLIGLGTGYFLWGTRVARLTEALSGLTLEIDTMRARLATPQAAPENGGVRMVDELRVINESIAAFRQELVDQKALVEKATSAEPATSAAASAELSTVKSDLAACIADKLDLQARCGGAGAAAEPAPNVPAYRPPVAPAPPPMPPTYRPYDPR